jgi:hypothetical protein
VNDPGLAMLVQMFRGFQLLHGALLALSAIGFFIFWARTRFWLPKYAHFLAAIGLVVGLWCVTHISEDAPINKQSPIAKSLLALVLPAIVYFFFVFYGGQTAAFKSRFAKSSPCPSCRLPVEALPTGRDTPNPLSSSTQRQCPHCGQILN